MYQRVIEFLRTSSPRYTIFLLTGVITLIKFTMINIGAKKDYIENSFFSTVVFPDSKYITAEI
jgi:hypothetical protein